MMRKNSAGREGREVILEYWANLLVQSGQVTAQVHFVPYNRDVGSSGDRTFHGEEAGHHGILKKK